MSKNINVNPGQYKVAGRERQGEAVVTSENKAEKSIKDHELRQQSHKRQKNAGRKTAK